MSAAAAAAAKPDTKSGQPEPTVLKRKLARGERNQNHTRNELYALPDGYSEFRTDQQQARRLLIDRLTELKKTVDGPASSAAAASSDGKSVINYGTYGLYFGVREGNSNKGLKFAEDLMLAQHAVRSLQPVTDSALQGLTASVSRELRLLMMVSDLRKLATGLTAKSTIIAWRLSDSIVDLLSDVLDDEPIGSPSFPPSSPSYGPSDLKLDAAAAGTTGRKIISLKRPIRSLTRPPSPARNEANDAGFVFLSDDVSDNDELPTDESAAASAESESHLKTTVCAGCDKRKKCGKINLNAEESNGTKYVRFYFGYPVRHVNRYRYNLKNDDWLCCCCGVAVLHTISRIETLGDQKDRFDIENGAIAVGPIGCDCLTCGGDSELSIPTAYSARILNGPATATATDEDRSDDQQQQQPQPSPKKLKTEPPAGPVSAAAAAAVKPSESAVKPSVKPSESAAASAAASDDS
jgi:hypothetical protein